VPPFIPPNAREGNQAQAGCNFVFPCETSMPVPETPVEMRGKFRRPPTEPLMKWIDSLEARFGRHAFPGLIRAVVGLNALTFLLYKMRPDFFEFLTLDKGKIVHGEVWRLVTYLFIPQYGGFFSDYVSVLLYLWFLWFLGDGLEHALGAFKLNLFYLIGMIGNTAAALCFSHNATGDVFSGALLNASLFYAFARFYPNLEIYLFFVLPVKIKWLAWLSGAFLLLGFVAGTASYRMTVLVSLANYLLFFGPEILHETRHRKSVAGRRRQFEKVALPEAETLHCCVVCSRTEKSHPDLEFRVGGDGSDYCIEHLPARTGNP
jgi:membrane associated rhomboid family serine protease